MTDTGLPSFNRYVPPNKKGGQEYRATKTMQIAILYLIIGYWRDIDNIFLSKTHIYLFISFF